ncbi:hypothetical protein [Gluconobacter sphaericus]|uniref:Uncharacterized protein n=2 Tax=Gluconobacter sphaericus TaxID=574987 RepID=A0AA37SI26_9PROT|nr:hypothetical protein [Gluconobacter sphaericus]MBF0885048.1 hypothetical protein [Gluconobacter sphaericus]MBS1085818.1 hypothetical protein [Gluconobacter sphaericus]MBS1099707.1 hypothetical protein [Gluconobacter sphaericus]QQX91771.1 hypothetical protein IGS75_03975 [Gluconobacter sphaericus]GEB41851.1 hypothetical protein GSP01_06330 [Gluconobacter sphaericus NBRC 12467]
MTFKRWIALFFTLLLGLLMVRTHARIWIGLLACLLMQVGLLLSTSTVQARTAVPHQMAMVMHHKTHHQKPNSPDCCNTSAFHAISYPQQSPEGCCHTHAVSTDPMLTVTSIQPSSPVTLVTRAFTSGRHDRFNGTDWIPASPPPKLRAI